MEFVATTNEVFFGGKFINGFAVGTLQTVAGTYVGEVGRRSRKYQHLTADKLVTDRTSSSSRFNDLPNRPFLHSWAIHGLSNSQQYW